MNEMQREEIRQLVKRNDEILSNISREMLEEMPDAESLMEILRCVRQIRLISEYACRCQEECEEYAVSMLKRIEVETSGL